MSLLSKKCIYALRATMYAAVHAEEGGYVSISRMSRELDISFHFLTKVLQDLTQAGLLQSMRGPAGGVALAQSASNITLWDIVERIEGPEILTGCILGLQGCGERKPCPLHQLWAEERKGFRRVFASVRLSDVSEPVMNDLLRLAD